MLTLKQETDDGTFERAIWESEMDTAPFIFFNGILDRKLINHSCDIRKNIYT